MRWYRIALLASVAATPFVACSLDEGGFAIDNPDGSIIPDANTADVKTDSSSDAGPGDANPNACPGGDFGKCTALKLPAGWVPIGYRDDGSSCPEGFDTLPRVTTPIGGGSCTCDTAQVAVAGTKCPGTALKDLHWDNGVPEKCEDTTTNPDVTFPDGGCYSFSSTRIMNHFKATPLPTSATCTLAGVPNDAGVTAKSLKVCTSSSDSCKGVLCADKHVCIMHEGIVNECPDDFGDPRTIGTNVELTCARCNGTYSATCTGTASLFTDPACGTSPPDSVLVDNTCNAVTRPGGGGARAYASMRYAPTVSNEACAAAGAAPKPTAKLAGTATVCCHD